MLKVTCAIIVEKNKVLAAQCTAASDHPFQWEFPGGKIHENETSESCIVREIAEELDIEVEIEQKMDAVCHDYGFKQIELIPFLCFKQSGEIRLNEHHKIGWFTLGELEKLDFAAADLKLLDQEKNRQILKKYLGENVDNDG